MILQFCMDSNLLNMKHTVSISWPWTHIGLVTYFFGWLIWLVWVNTSHHSWVCWSLHLRLSLFSFFPGRVRRHPGLALERRHAEAEWSGGVSPEVSDQSSFCKSSCRGWSHWPIQAEGMIFWLRVFLQQRGVTRPNRIFKVRGSPDSVLLYLEFRKQQTCPGPWRVPSQLKTLFKGLRPRLGSCLEERKRRVFPQRGVIDLPSRQKGNRKKLS